METLPPDTTITQAHSKLRGDCKTGLPTLPLAQVEAAERICLCSPRNPNNL
jgi:hypothetical protein